MTDQKIAGFVANLGRKPSLLNFDPAQGLTISIELEEAEPVDVIIRTLQEKELVDFIYRAAAQSLPIYLETREGRLLQAKVPYSELANVTEGEDGDFEVSIGISLLDCFSDTVALVAMRCSRILMFFHTNGRECQATRFRRAL